MPGSPTDMETRLVDVPNAVAPALAWLVDADPDRHDPAGSDRAHTDGTHTDPTVLTPGSRRDAEAAVRIDLDAPLVGVDVERADADRYHRDAALIQVGVAGRCVLLDGTTLTELAELQAFLASDGRVTVLHAVENDIAPLAAKGVHAPRVADTAVAAALLGLPTGLRALLTTVLDLELDGDKSALQRADWAARPLTGEMVAYAAGDVVHLPALWEALAGRLEAAGRTHWYEQELEATLAHAASDSRHWTRVKGAGRLSPPQRAVLRAVWEARETLAREHDIAPNRLLHDTVLCELAVNPPATEADLVRRSQRRRSLLRRYAPTLLAAVHAGQAAAPEARESSGRRWTDQDRALYDALRRARTEVAAGLDLDPGVVCPSRPLWGAVAGTPRDGDELCTLAGLRPWQHEVLAAPLWETYVRFRGERSSPADEGDRGHLADPGHAAASEDRGQRAPVTEDQGHSSASSSHGSNA